MRASEKMLTSICDALDEEKQLTLRVLSERFYMSKAAVYKRYHYSINVITLKFGSLITREFQNNMIHVSVPCFAQ